ncbi:MAG: dehydrogenase [Allomuricauda sp.]|nr:MAG: dehydrogenase [Allomuricauda sp.]
MRSNLPLALLLILLLTFSCKKEYAETEIDLSTYELEPGLTLQAIAAEPLIESPVAMNFDAHGNIWVLEMPGYMQSLEGVNEEDPIGRILVLQDKDADGIADHTKVFLDSLKLARAFAHVYDGLLYAEPPNLLFTKINADFTPGATVVVDSAYAVGGNVEHQPNGLLMNIDNWIYNAKDSKRYRLKNGIWEKEKTTFRGQWGITHDAMGRLFYNDNSNQLRGDYSLPNVVNQNIKYRASKTVGQTIVKDQSVYPVQATAVNRGYIPGMLHEDGKLKNFTSACGPLYFEGNGLSSAYQSNFFVCGPEVNLIKRNLIYSDSLKVSGKQALTGKEFLRSSDEAFRPVNLFNGPDGALYVVDMHKGIIQHKTYLTSYLRNLYIEKGLDTVHGMGRILRISKDSLPYKPINLKTLSDQNLVDSLSSSNIWVRDKAQHLLITRNAATAVPELEAVLGKSNNEFAKIHALYTLEGLQKLNLSRIAVEDFTSYPKFVSHVLKLMAEDEHELSTSQLEKLMAVKHESLDFYLTYFLSKNFDVEKAAPLIEILKDGNEMISEAFLSGIHKQETAFLDSKISQEIPTTRKVLDSLSTSKVILTENFAIGEDGLTRGRVLYNNNCATCHGPDGRGLENLAPPLLNSEFVSNKEHLVAIMLYGMHGPVSVGKKDYNFANAMPGIGVNETLTDKNIRDIGNFIRNAFTTSPQNITTKTIDSLRKIDRTYDKTFTQKELHEIFASN